MTTLFGASPALSLDAPITDAAKRAESREATAQMITMNLEHMIDKARRDEARICVETLELMTGRPSFSRAEAQKVRRLALELRDMRGV
jgi:hypothetical protein